MPGYLTRKRILARHAPNLVISVLTTTALLGGLQTAISQAPPTTEIKPPRPKNRTGTRKLESTITALDKKAQPPRITLKDGVLSVSIKPTTLLVQEERGVTVSDLKLDDKISLISFKSKGTIRSNAVVSGLNPLVITVAGVATLTITHVENVTFSRYTPLQTDALAVGQTVALEMKLLKDGEIEATRIAVVVEKQKTVKPPTGKRGKEKQPGDGDKRPTLLPTANEHNRPVGIGLSRRHSRSGFTTASSTMSPMAGSRRNTTGRNTTV